MKKKKSEAEEELAKLYVMRQNLIEKNLSGLYSDEIFREQNSAIEDRIQAFQVAESDTVLERYN